MKNKELNEFSVKEFRELPELGWKDGLKFTSFIPIPRLLKEGLHDSGYRFIDYVIIKNFKAIGRLGSYSDVLHLNGIGGFGYRWVMKYETVPKELPVIDWNFDCLVKSGLMHFFSQRYDFYVEGYGVSSMEIYAIKK